MATARTPVPDYLARSVSAVVLERSANWRALEGLSSSALILATAGPKVYCLMINFLCIIEVQICIRIIIQVLYTFLN